MNVKYSGYGDRIDWFVLSKSATICRLISHGTKLALVNALVIAC